MRVLWLMRWLRPQERRIDPAREEKTFVAAMGLPSQVKVFQESSLDAVAPRPMACMDLAMAAGARRG
ncbi:MAG: hypothetical protein KME02_07370 [Aphanothece saxicola GSE-SYN-MK-01-06B]|jgi:hypothetical protein|nr:hypothetical protein [Aphanothece saxicola GSE-SYN-MK-01-06B]